MRQTAFDFTFLFHRSVTLRVVRVALPTGETEVLISNLFDVPYEDFLSLYFKRWPIETKYNILKNKLELGNFSGYSPNAILQDFWACIHLANIVATAKAEANELLQLRQENAENIYQYAPNTAQLVGSLKDYFIEVCFLPRKRQRDAAMDRMLVEISRAVSPIRPGRCFWRNPWQEKLSSALMLNLIFDLKLLTLNSYYKTTKITRSHNFKSRTVLLKYNHCNSGSSTALLNEFPNRSS